MAKDPELLAHQEWLGYLQPVGLVVSPPALAATQAHVNKNIIPDHTRFLESLKEFPLGDKEHTVFAVADLPGFVRNVLGWEPADLLGGPDTDPLPAELEVTLTDYNETLRPSYAVREVQPRDGAGPWLMLIQSVARGLDLDEAVEQEGQHWHASPQARFERLLRETKVSTGLLVNGTSLRLVYAPRGENSGHLTFPVQAMSEVSGRPIFAALHMLLYADRLFTLPEKQRLPALLAESRKYQNLVSTQLANQVLAALHELLRGFQAADEKRNGKLLKKVLQDDPNQVYKGLLTTLLRLVFTLYAEDRGLLSSDPIFANFYSITGLFERLRDDASRYPDTMDQRYGAWPQLLTLFRMIHDGARHGTFHLPARRGYLFDPDRYCFLEGRTEGTQRQPDETIDPPMVADGVIFRVLENLLILDGERLSYRTLDVEQIGSVYEAVMGYNLHVADGRSVAIKPKKAHGAPVTINLQELLKTSADKRAKWFKEQTEQSVTGDALAELKTAKTPEEAVAALERRIAKNATPNIVPSGAMILQPSDERRRSGSHYTPRTLTEPIVRKALEPILKGLGIKPRPNQILDLKVCDPAMGSGAFLVEACRQLGDSLIASWHAHGAKIVIPPDEDEVLHARRIIAQRCLYGVDKNPMAVDLAKMSLWLATLAKEHPFTFVDHALRCGDSLVGLTKEQIARFHWKPKAQQMMTGQEKIAERIERATRARREILEAGDEVAFTLKQQKLANAEDSLNPVRFVGNLAIASFFDGENDRVRQTRRDELLAEYTEYQRTGDMKLQPTAAEKALRAGPKGVSPFHWGIEFPEVFGRENPGFDVIVGNPPFMGGTMISTAFGNSYKDWLYTAYEESGNRMDLVAYFFRRAFQLIRDSGAFGLIATNTIAQGDTRAGGLRYICTHGGTIYRAYRRQKWPGLAAVIVSVVHILRGRLQPPFDLAGRNVERITAFLFHQGGHDDPQPLNACQGLMFEGFKLAGQGFLFDDTDEKASPLIEMEQLINRGRNRERVFPYIGGEEVNDSPTHAFHRYAIDFGDMPLDQVEANWAELLAIVRQKVKPYRDSANRDAHRERWWQYGERRPGLRRAVLNLPRVLAIARVSQALAFAFLPNGMVYSEQLEILTLPTSAAFCTLQCRVHQVWARFFSSSMKDDLRYTSSDCFETFPFPIGFETDPKLEEAGKAYYELRANLMVTNNEGLTKTYNRFHDPNETSPAILKLRELHAVMDRAVLDAYGWTDLKPTCEFVLDYEDDEDEEDNGGGRQRKKPWRYRWPDEFRDEVLARLLDLNRERAEEERLSGAAVEAKEEKKTRKNSKQGRRTR